jgi:hypothetical protein
MKNIYKIFLRLLIIIVFLQISQAQHKSSEYRDRIKKLCIKTMTIYQVNYGQNLLCDSLITSYVEYDRNGNITKNSYFQEGALTFEYFYSYDSDNVLTIDSTKYYFNGMLNSITISKHDKKGRIIEYVSRHSREFIDYLSIYSYSPDGALKTDRNISHGDTTIYYTRFRKNENGRVLSEKTFRSDGTFSTEIIKILDCNDNIIKEIWNSYDKQFDFKSLNKYNSENQNIETIEFDGYGNLKSRRVYTYDLNNNIVNCIEYDSLNNIVSKYYYFYGIRN